MCWCFRLCFFSLFFTPFLPLLRLVFWGLVSLYYYITNSMLLQCLFKKNMQENMYFIVCFFLRVRGYIKRITAEFFQIWQQGSSFIHWLKIFGIFIFHLYINHYQITSYTCPPLYLLLSSYTIHLQFTLPILIHYN